MFLKKIIPCLLFLPTLGLLIYFSNPFWQNFNLVFSLSIDDLFKIIYLSAFILLSGLFFVVFVALAQDYRIILPVILVSAVIPFLLTPLNINYILAATFLLGFSFIFFLLHSDLKSYLTFSSTKILIPHIKQTATILTLILSLAYFYGINQEIKAKGFQIPDSLIDTALSFSGQSNQPTSQAPSIDKSTLDQLKMNPNLLKQYGLDPSLLDQLNPSNLIPSDSIKKQVKTQFENIISPYIKYIPYLLAFLFFTTISFINTILSSLLFPIVWFIFWLLDKSGYTKYEVEMREVRKLVI